MAYQIDDQSITKSDVPYTGRPTVQLCVFGLMTVALAWAFFHTGLYPGIIEVCLGCLGGIPLGLLTARREIITITRVALARRVSPGSTPWRQPLDPDWGWAIFGYLAALLIFAAVSSLDYWLWSRLQGLSLPWARFAYSVKHEVGFLSGWQTGFCLEALPAMGFSAIFIGCLVRAIRMLQWYRNLPPHPFHISTLRDKSPD